MGDAYSRADKTNEAYEQQRRDPIVTCQNCGKSGPQSGLQGHRRYRCEGLRHV